MKIQVTQEDINTGVAGHCGRCPVARAARRAVPTATGVVVSATTIRFWYQDTEGADRNVVYDLPRKVSQAIDQFDSSGFMVPLEFTLDVPAEGLPF